MASNSGFLWNPWFHGHSYHKSEDPFLRLFFKGDTLPASLSDAHIRQFERIGVRFLGPHPESGDFLKVELPYWWNKVRQNHRAEFALLDKTATKRASCLLLDPEPKSGMSWSSLRYSTVVCTRLRLVERQVGEFTYTVNDGPRVVLSTESLQEALTYLGTFYPEWQDPNAYWDSPHLEAAVPL